MDCPNCGSPAHKKDGFANGGNNDTNSSNAGITIQSKKVLELADDRQSDVYFS